MLGPCLLVGLLTACTVYYVSAPDVCTPLPRSHFQWLNADGSLVIPPFSPDGAVVSQDGSQSLDVNQCSALPQFPSCQYCSSKAILFCYGISVYNVPNETVLPTTRLSLYLLSGIGLISLPPKSFSGLFIQKLAIVGSNLQYLALDTFSGVNSINSLYLKNNELDYIPQADYLFRNIKDLNSLSLEDNSIKVLASTESANMHNLQYFSLAGNPLYTMDVFFLQNSGLKFFDLRSVTFKLKHMDIKGSGLCKLPSSLDAIDLSRATITSWAIDKLMEQLKGKSITTLSLSYIHSQFRSFWGLRHIKDSLEYLSLKVSSTPNPTTQHNQKSTIPQPAARMSAWSWEWTYFIIGPMMLASVLGSLVYLKWWNIRCYFHRYISLRKANLLQKNGNSLVKSEIYYDVFVSYSDVDRAWVLDNLVPNLENSDVSLCFHERDFQVGMSILENIIDCMDRSHALLLVVSSAFIYSKWCQFEMHLAQNRLIETFKDQLVLVLLEDIPRKARPQTLHYLMMTKTYLMWPQHPCKDEAYELFWRRLKRALIPNPKNIFHV